MQKRIGALACAALLVIGCGGSADEIDSFRVVTSTGPNGTDENIFFCFTEPGLECHELSTSSNDFETNQTDTFTFDLDAPIPRTPGISGITLENHGGGFL